MPSYQHVKVPAGGAKITVNADYSINVPDNPIIPYIEGDGTGLDITPVMIKVVDAAVAKAYGGKRKIHWMEIYAGEKSTKVYGPDVWLPEETLSILKDYVVSIKGPLTTPVGGGIRSLNVALRQELDLYVCLRPVRYFKGVPSPVKHPERVDMVIFRENSEDIYAGVEWAAESEGAKKVIDFLIKEMGVKKIRFPATSGIGIKPVSREGTERLVRKAMQYTIDNDRKSVALVHKGNIMKFTEGAFRDWGYALAQNEFGAKPIDGGPWCSFKNPKTGRDIVVKDVIADAFLQQILTRPREYSVIATMNLNGDYISDALAAQVGGIGIAPGGNINYITGHAVFEATHGTAPKYANLDKVNPGSLILSAEMMLRQSQLLLGEVSESYSLKQEKGVVLSQDPKAEASVERNALVNVVVSGGPPPSGINLMPDFQRKNITEVREWASGAGVTVKESKDMSSLFPFGVVLTQEPSPDTVLAADTKVSLTISGRPGKTGADNAAAKNFHYELAQGGSDSLVRIVVVDKYGERELFNGLRKPGSKIDMPISETGGARVKIFLNGILVEERDL